MVLRVAAVQAEAVPGAFADNVRRAAELTARAGEAGADLVVFPEAFVTGYDDALFLGPLPTLQDLSWLEPLQAVVDRSDLVVVINTALDRGDRRTLTDFVLSPGRSPWAAYDKQHLHPPERAVFTPGAHGASFRLRDMEVALSVCYDGNFPEHAAAAAADGAVVYVNSGAYFPGGAARRDLHNAARALDNGIFVVFSGLVGAPSDFIGGSAIFDPIGTRISWVEGTEGIALADLDVSTIAEVREQQQMWSARRDALGDRLQRRL